MSIGYQKQRIFVILDRQQVNKAHMITIISSVILFIVLGLLFFLVSQIEYLLIYGSLAIVIQLLFGMIATRSYHSWGMKVRSKLGFLDPAGLSLRWTLEESKLQNGELERYFESIHSKLEKLDVEVTDDINDLAWFAVTVWSIGSVILFMLLESLELLYSISPPVLAALCFFIYYYSYKTNMDGYFSDDVNHLEFHVMSKIAKLRSIIPSSSQTYVRWMINRDRYVLYDVIIRFDLTESENPDIEYSMGLPSTKKEQIVVKLHSIKGCKSFQKDPVVKMYWDISDCTEAPCRLVVSNKSTNIDLAKRSTYVRIQENPMQLEEVFREIVETFFKNI